MTRLAALACAICVLASAAGAAGASRQAPNSPGLIFFWSDSPWPSIWSMRPDGSHLRRILRTRANAKRPSLSPDRQWVAFDGTPPGQAPLSNFDIQVVRLTGEDRRTLVGSPSPLTEIDAQWSPDGSRLSFSRWPSTWQQSEIWTVRADGSELTRIAAGVSARWSPDGQEFVFQFPTDESGDVSLMNADGTGVRQLMATPQLESPAAWSPDGKKILFTRSRTGYFGTDVFVMNADGTNVRKLTRAPGDQIAAAWSPDGSKILYTSGRPGHSQLLVMNADGSHKRSISRNRFTGYEPSWR